MPEPSKTGPRLYTIPPSAPFLTTLARAILGGDLPVPGGAKPDPLTLPLATIYLPTRRAARALREAFLAEAKGGALLLPRIRALGDVDEEAAIIFGAEESVDDGASGTGKSAIGALPRRLALTRLVLAWGRLLRTEAAGDRSIEAPPLITMSPAQASYLAADLARLMDSVESEEIELTALDQIVPEALAKHWELNVDFLKIVTERWPEHLAENNLVSPIVRRNALMAIEAERLAASGSPHPVIAAGSTGTVPATARLLQTIASLPNGAVILPGLDLILDDESWQSLPDHPEHPQAGMAELLRKLGVARRDVACLPGSEPDAPARARLHLVSEALRPADSTDRWQRFLASDELAPEGREGIANALVGLRTLVAPTAHDEAEAIALILKSAIDIPGKTAALVTPDRVLARRVAARLRRFDLTIDDSAGLPIGRTVTGAFLDLVLGAAASDFAPPELMALLKHPLTRLGRRPAEIRSAARALERGAFRDIYVGHGLGGAIAALKVARGEDKYRYLITEDEQSVALKLVADLEAAFAPLAALFSDRSRHPTSSLAQAHVAAAEALARDEQGSESQLWSGEDGEALSILLAELIAAGKSTAMSASDYAPFYRSLVAGQVVRPRGQAHPRLFIWGPLEARLQQPDLVVLGSLNEGVWPRPQDAGPWLSPRMRETLGLSPPERFTGLSAHDFAQSLSAKIVYLTRALKVDGVPTVPSRWLQRLLALVDATGLAHKIKPEQPWVAWARERDRAPDFAPAEAPKPCPPVDARPRKLSVTRIEKWIANPYEIFAKNILKLEPLKPLGAEPDPALRGQIVHQTLHDFARAFPDSLPADIAGELTQIADRHFTALGGSPRVEAFWRPYFQRFARWFAATEPARRARAVRSHTEVDGALDLAVGSGFKLTARADRIDETENGDLLIYDYKTGKPPIQKHVDELFAPQLPLEAAIAEGGGFGELGKREVRELLYIQASGRHDGGEESQAGKSDATTLAAMALAELTKLVERFDRADTPYEVKRRPAPAFARTYDYDDYAQLARLQEWLTLEAEEEW